MEPFNELQVGVAIAPDVCFELQVSDEAIPLHYRLAAAISDYQTESHVASPVGR